MGDPVCIGCAAPIGGGRVCRRCGTAQQPPATEAEERAVLHEWRALFHAWELAERSDGGVSLPLIIKNGLLPTHPDLLVDEALYALKLMGEATSAFDPARARFETLLTALELKAFAEPTLARRIPVLKQQAAELQRRASTENRVIALVLLGILVSLGAVVWAVARLFIGD